MEKHNHRVESGSNCTVYFAYNKYLDNAWFAYHGHVLGEVAYEI